MGKITVLNHKDQSILYLDFSGSTEKEIIDGFIQLKKIVTSRPAGSLLVMANLNNIKFNSQFLSTCQEYLIFNGPLLKASAVFGVGNNYKKMFEHLLKESKRNIPNFETMEEAKDWLVSQLSIAA
ncbi:MAG: hypothetical protein HQK51_01920 [Oligoflexia bacterium]|nr:hypothetical protein [Oligoflexia bacterium]